jgi:hypothetical protein
MIFISREFIFYILILLTLLSQSVISQSGKVKEIIWSSKLNIRNLAETYLGNPNLWPTILSYNNITSINDLREGRKLLIPHGEVLEIIKDFIQTEKSISVAIDNGAKIFSQKEIELSLSLFSKALELRSKNNWPVAGKMVKESAVYAVKALKRTTELRDQNAEAFVSKKKGTVQNRKPNFQSWTNTSLFEKLFEQDLTRTLSSSFAEITFSDLNQIRLNENSQAVILKSRINLLNNKTESQVKLEKGDAYAKLFNTPKKEFNLNVTGVKTKINSDLFWIDKQETQTKVANYKGEISLEAAGSMVLLKENQGSMIPKGKAPTPPQNLLPPPQLISPETFAKINVSDVTIGWSQISGANEYWIEIATDSRFSSLFQMIKNVKGTSYKFSNLPPNVYYWRVASVDDLGFPGKFSNHFIFTLEVDTTAPFLFVNLLDDFIVTKEKETQLEIQTEKEASLLINNKQFVVDKSGNHESEITLVDGLNLLEVIASDKSGNKTFVKKEIFAEFNPSVELFDESKNRVEEEIYIYTNKNNFTGFTRPLALVKIRSDISKLETSTYADQNGFFSVTIPRLVDEDSFQLRIVTRAGHSLVKNIKIKN